MIRAVRGLGGKTSKPLAEDKSVSFFLVRRRSRNDNRFEFVNVSTWKRQLGGKKTRKILVCIVKEKSRDHLNLTLYKLLNMIDPFFQNIPFPPKPLFPYYQTLQRSSWERLCFPQLLYHKG